MDAAVFWLTGNLALPLVPLLVSAAVLKAVGRRVDEQVLLADGVLFFYGATLAAVFLMDLCRRLTLGAAPPPSMVAIMAAVALLVLIVSTAAYALAVFGRSGGRGADGEALELRWLSSASWKLACIEAILFTTARAAYGLF